VRHFGGHSVGLKNSINAGPELTGPAFRNLICMKLQKVLAGTSAERIGLAGGQGVNVLRCATLFGIKGFSGGAATNNSGDVLVGLSETELPIKVSPGEEVDFALPNGASQDLYEMWIQGASGDGVYIIFY
jgi:hypothetical protein